MEKSNKPFWYIIIILVILLVSGFTYLGNKNAKLEKQLWESAEFVADTVMSVPEITGMDSARVSKKDGVLVPKIVYRDTGSFKQVPFTVYDTIKEPFDTNAFLVDYLSLKFAVDSITKQDVEIKVFDTLQRNKILNRRYEILNLRTEDFYKTRQLYLGGTIGGSESSFSIGPSLSYLDKKGNLFSGHYLYSPKDNKSIYFSYQKKISLKRK